MRCKNCHYSLANLTGPPHRCPECGREFDPDDPDTFSQGFSWRRWLVCLFFPAIPFSLFMVGGFALGVFDPSTRWPSQLAFALIGAAICGCVWLLVIRRYRWGQ